MNYQRINIENYGGLFSLPNGQNVSNGLFNNIYLESTFARSTIYEPIFPTEGSSFSVALQLTPPYSLINNKSYDNVTIQEKYKTSSIIITHDIACVRLTADRIIMLHDGQVYAEGKLAEFEESKDPLIMSFFK